MASRAAASGRSFPSPPGRKPAQNPSLRGGNGWNKPGSERDDRGDKVAQEVLRDQRLKQDQRRQDETRDRLGNIQDRISRALSKYDLGDGGQGGDFKLDRRQSEQAFDVIILGFNESADKKSKLLESLYNFFLVYEEEDSLTTPEVPIDVESNYTSATDALSSATASLERLAAIHSNIVDSYSTKLKDKENKRKTKQLEKSFKDAQSELLALKETLETTTKGLADATSKAEGLRKTLEMKTSDLEKNRIVIDKLRKQAENCLGVDEKKLLNEKTQLLTILEKENAELKLHLGELEFKFRKSSSQSIRDSNSQDESEERLAELRNNIAEERDRHEEALRMARAGLEAEYDETMEQQTEEHQLELAQLRAKLSEQENTIIDLESKLAEAIRPVHESTPSPVSSAPSIVPATISERTSSAVSVDPTEALNKKYKELEEEYEKKRAAVEEQMAQNEEENISRVEKLKGGLDVAREQWEQEKEDLEEKVERFRKMVAEMEADSHEKTHKLTEMLKDKKREEEMEICSVAGDSSDETGGSSAGKPSVTVRPNTALRNTLTPGPENPVIEQVITMYDHVTDFKEKLIDILSEIQNMGVIDETETMLMIRSMEKIDTMRFDKNSNVHQQIEGIQNSIAHVMHSSEKTVHKIFKKLSKERGKIERLSWEHQPARPRSTRSTKRGVEQCDRATSPILKKKQYVPQNTDKTITRRPAAQYTAMFAHTDMEHNKRTLKRALIDHKITPKQYEEVITMMQDYTAIPQKRLQQIAKHYISHARMQIMEENIQMNRPVDEDIDDVLNRLDELYLLRKTRYGEDMDELAAEREDLAYILTKQLDRLENQSGIFLIKPYIAYKAHTLNQNQDINRTKKGAVFIGRADPGDKRQENIEQDHGGGPTWSVGESRTSPIHDWVPEIPKLLEMDCNRITVARNTVSQPVTTGAYSKTIKSFVVVRPSKSTGSYRPKSTATSAEFLSFNSDYKSESVSMETSENLPPLRSGYTSGFVSTSNSRQRLAPILSPPSSINVEKAATVT